ncbi:SRPBCC family protein [Mycolicibacterium sp. PAM1]|uniref:SRPBCC family protein n=1 Tax=Mycolicibacterium sp. PAM1 TaxID=2853535 RepID=UPI001C3D52FB|nr:SRPBCC family protein [Mycolicibacterium sp. PAM1]MBV5242527.1 SRPBCC family protein [Mycolicibacterium sp. PAM1]
MTKRMIRAAVAAAALYGARRYFRDWGTTKGESASVLAGDELLGPPVLQATEGVSIDAPVDAVWPWVVQIGQDRGGLYSFETLENAAGLDYHNADAIHPEWQHLAVGDSVRLVPRKWFGLADGVEMTVARMTAPQSIVLRAAPPGLPWEMVWSFHLIPRVDDQCRLLIRSRLALRHPGEVVAAELVGPARAFVTRGILLGIKRRAEKAVKMPPVQGFTPAHTAEDLRP